MPKELIHDDLGTFDIHVGWQPGHEVQVGTVVANGIPLIRHLYAADAERIGAAILSRGTVEDPADLGRNAIQAITETGGNPDGPYRGIYATLDRSACNRLIRALRKARDAAYGRDE